MLAVDVGFKTGIDKLKYSVDLELTRLSRIDSKGFEVRGRPRTRLCRLPSRTAALA